MLYYFSYVKFKIFNPKRIKNTRFGKKTFIGNGSHVVNSELGDFSYIAYNTKCYNTRIGNYCSIGSDCVIGGAEHPLTSISSSPVFYDKKNPCKVYFGNWKWDSFSKETIIGNDVWIGDHSLIKAGLSIGNGSVVGMGSVVTKNIPPYEVWAGNPAKFIKRRFNEEIVADLMNSNWWVKEPDDNLIKYINDSKGYISCISKKD